MRAVFVVALCAVVGACAGNPAPMDSGISSHETRLEKSSSPLLISLRYPAAFSDEAIKQLRNDYMNNPRMTWFGWEDYAPALDDSIVKTSFYAHDLYKYLAAHMPKGTVILEPGYVGIRDGQYYYSNLRETIPAALNIDFFAYNTPRAHFSMGLMLRPNTYGDQYSPIIIGTSAVSVEGEVSSVLFSAEDFHVSNQLGEYKGAFVLNGIAKKITFGGALSQGYPLKKGEAYEFPKVFMETSDDEWNLYVGGIASRRHDYYAAGAKTREIGNIIIESLRNIDVTRADDIARSRIRQLYALSDKELAFLSPIQRSEAQFMAARSEAFVKSCEALDTSMALKISSERENEKAVYGATNKAAMGVVSAGMAGLASGGMIANPGVLQAMVSGNVTAADISASYEQNFSAINTSLTHTSVSLGEKEINVDAVTLASLREKLRKLVARNGQE